MTFDRNMPFNDLPHLPPSSDCETKPILRKTIAANRALAELKSKCRLIPNEFVLLNNLALLEAKASSEIENIFTTHDKLFRADVLNETQLDPVTKEVTRYRQALWNGVEAIRNRPLNTNSLIEIVQTIKQNTSGIRSTPGTKIATPSGEIIYTPPEGESVIRSLLKNLEDFIHADDMIDPLIKMALIHYQFEAIHPFSDGNGRTGRILNIIYLMHVGLLGAPVLFLSGYIIKHRSDYYQRLLNITEVGAWEDWVIYMLDAVEETSIETGNAIDAIEAAIQKAAQLVKENEPGIYSRDLIDLIFKHAYCRIDDLVESRLISTRQTASQYLKKLENLGILEHFKMGRGLIYVNKGLIEILKK